MRTYRRPLAAILLASLLLSGCVITIPPAAPQETGEPVLPALAPQTFPPPDDLAGSLAIADREGVRLHWPSTGASLTVHALSPADSSRPPSGDTALLVAGGRAARLTPRSGRRGTEEDYLLATSPQTCPRRRAPRLRRARGRRWRRLAFEATGVERPPLVVDARMARCPSARTPTAPAPVWATGHLDTSRWRAVRPAGWSSWGSTAR